MNNISQIKIFGERNTGTNRKNTNKIRLGFSYQTEVWQSDLICCEN